MVSLETARQLALSLPEVTEQKHFETPDFRVKKKIFATLRKKEKRVVVKLNPIDQSVFCAFDSTIIFPIPGGWGKQGWTFINLSKVKKSMLRDALATAWKTVAPVALRKKYFEEEGR